MKFVTPAKTLITSTLLCVLSACSTDTPAPAPAAPTEPASIAKPEQRPALPAYQRELTGSLLNVPAAADVELALLAVDQRGRPHALLGDIRLRGTGSPLAFNLRFNPETFSKYQKIELHGRVSQSGLLIQQLPPQTIRSAETQTLSPLSMVPAP